MMKKINKTVKEILENPDLRKKAEAYPDSDDIPDDDYDDEGRQTNNR